jgi:hypothetical protein
MIVRETSHMLITGSLNLYSSRLKNPGLKNKYETE